ncbi:Autophagy-related protein 2 [Diplonema papillatum]|nr:Autophagy-related protein 2 [Diplonema papillatum]
MQCVNWVYDKVLRFVVKRVLSRFLKKLDPEQFQNISITEGFTLTKLEFDTEVINETILAGLPIQLTYGRIGKIHIGWSLQTLRLKFDIRDVDLVVDFITRSDVKSEAGSSIFHDGKAVDDIARSVLIGSVSREDLESLGRDDAKADDEFQSAQVKDLIDKTVQRMKVGVRNGNLSIRFQNSARADKVDIVRVEIPWLDLTDKDMLPSDRTHGKFYCKVLTFQSFIVYLHTVTADENLLSSTLMSPRSQRTSHSHQPKAETNGEKNDPTLDVIFMGYADNQNSVEVTFPSDLAAAAAANAAAASAGYASESFVGLRIGFFLQSLHCILAPRHLQTLKGLADIISLSTGDSKPSDSCEDEQPEGGYQLALTFHIVNLTAALLQSDKPPPEWLWDSLLQQIETEPIGSTGNGNGGTASLGSLSSGSVASPCKALEDDHILFEVSQNGGEPSGIMIRTAADDTGSKVEFALSVVNVTWRTKTAAGTSSVLPSDVTSPNGMTSRKLVEFLTVRGPHRNEPQKRPQVTILITTSSSRQKHETVVKQSIRVRMSPRINVYAPLMKDLLKFCGQVFGSDAASPDFGRSSSCGSLQSCEVERSNFRRTNSASSGSPISSASDFDDAFRERDGYRRFSANPPPAAAASSSSHPPAVHGHEPTFPKSPEHFPTRSVTFGSSTIHASPKHSTHSHAASSSKASIPPPSLMDSHVQSTMFHSCIKSSQISASPPRLSGSAVQLTRETTISGQTEIIVYFANKEKDDQTLIGPYLQSILDYHSDGSWLGCSLRLKLDDCELKSTQSRQVSVVAFPAEEPPTAWKLSSANLKLYLIRKDVKNLIASFESGHGNRHASGAAGGSSIKPPRTPNIVVTLNPKADPAAVAKKTRAAEMLPEDHESNLREENAKHAATHVLVSYPSGAVSIKKDQVLLLQHLISELVAGLSTDAGTCKPLTESQLHTAGGGVPLSLLNTGATLKPWQQPLGTFALQLDCPKLTLDIQAPMCFPSDVPPPYAVPYPQEPPCFRYTLNAEGLSAFLVSHQASDAFARFAIDVASVELLEDRDVPIVRNYHNLYQRSHQNPQGKSQTHHRHNGLRVLLRYAQCSPSNPAFATIRDRQDLSLKVVLSRMILSHKVKQDANNWIMVLTELFTDVERVYENPADSDSTDDDDGDKGALSPAAQGRLRASHISVVANDIIIDYLPPNLSARILVVAEQITFNCLVVMLSEEFRAEVGVGPTTLHLDDGHFRRDLVAYDKEESTRGRSLFGKSMRGIVSDLELLGFVNVMETTGDDVKVIIKTFAPTQDCTPHIRGRGVHRAKRTVENDLDIAVEDQGVEAQKPFVVEVVGGSLKTNCCADSFRLLQEVIVHYISGDEQLHLTPIEHHYRIALGLPVVPEQAKAGGSAGAAPPGPSRGVADTESNVFVGVPLSGGSKVEGQQHPTQAKKELQKNAVKLAQRVGQVIHENARITESYPDDELPKNNGSVSHPIVLHERHYGDTENPQVSQCIVEDEHENHPLGPAETAPPEGVPEHAFVPPPSLVERSKQQPKVPNADLPSAAPVERGVPSPPMTMALPRDIQLESCNVRLMAPSSAALRVTDTDVDPDPMNRTVPQVVATSLQEVVPQASSLMQEAAEDDAQLAQLPLVTLQPTAGAVLAVITDAKPVAQEADDLAQAEVGSWHPNPDIDFNNIDLSDLSELGDLDDLTTESDNPTGAAVKDEPKPRKPAAAAASLSPPPPRPGQGSGASPPTPSDSFHEVDYADGGREAPPCVALPESKAALLKEQRSLGDFVEDDYFGSVDPPKSRLRTVVAEPDEPTPEFELVISGLSWHLHLYGGKDFVTSLSPDAVHNKLQGMKSSAVSAKQASDVYRSTRIYSQLVTFQLDDLFCLLDMFSPLGTADGHMWKLKAGARTVDVLDKLTVSSRNKLVTSVHSIDEQNDVIMCELKATVPKAMAGKRDALKFAELELFLNVEPLRVNVDQDALEFLARFFGAFDQRHDALVLHKAARPSAPPAPTPSVPLSSSSINATLTEDRNNNMHMVMHDGGADDDEAQLYFKKVTIGRISIKLDYNAKRCRFQNLLAQDLFELLNLLNIEGMNVELGEVTIEGCWSKALPSKLAQKWWETVHIADLLSGVPTVRSVTRISNSAMSLVSTPYKHYKMGKDPFSGIPHALADFLSKLTVEAVHLTEQAAIIGGGIVSAGVHVLESSHDDDTPAPALPQPGGAFEGIQQGYRTAAEDVGATMRVLESLPQAVRDGCVAVLARSVCLVLLKPLRGVFRGWCAIAQGSMTALDPQKRAEHIMLYKQRRAGGDDAIMRR